MYHPAPKHGKLMGPRVLITGLGIISAIGNGTGETLHSIQTRRSGIGRLSLFDSIHATIPVAEVPFTDAELRRMAVSDTPGHFTRNSLLALVATRQAMDASNWRRNPDLLSGTVLATTVGGMDYNERYYLSLIREDTHKDVISVLDSADCTEKVATAAGTRGYVTTISTACSSSANAIMLGARLIRSGRLKRVLVGGTDSLTRFTLNGFFSLEILSTTGCKPFDRDRNGLTIGEGAAMIVLESEEVADPGCVICEVSGYANINEAFHATASSADGAGALMAMSGALASAKLKPSDIDYINAHGTGTEINDLSEGRAIGNLFSGAISSFSSTKGYTGHTLGAAGAVEAVISALALRNEFIPGGLNHSVTMPELQFQPVSKNQHKKLRHVMSNSFGFGGNNTSVIFSAT
jgi:3-oxoacyl-[acyl-carrier-protein] synthase-1